MQPTLPDEQKPFGEAFIHMLRQVEPVKADQTVQDGETLDFCGGCEVVATPGHTAGHTSLFLPSLGVCIAGDAAVLEYGALIVANPEYAQDLAQAEHSLERIRQLGAHTIVCYHGGIYRVL
jgi:glyoxylase-like metal-dependent hydrolase (beta-lactamase superfamily II)